MAKISRAANKAYFQTDDIPTESQYIDTFDSVVNFTDDVVTTVGATGSDVLIPSEQAVREALNLKADALGADDNYVTDAEKTKLSNLSGTNTGDQTSIVGITGTISQFNTAVTDADFATLAGTETLTNKTLTSPKINEDVAITATATELNYCDGVTSNIQTQLNGKAASLGADDNYVTDAEKVKLSNLSGTNTGDQTISDATISLTDITTNDVSTTKHGFCPKAPNDTAKFLRGDGTWNTPSASSVEGTSVLSTGETGGSKFLREDGDGTCSWQTISGGGDALTSSPLSQFASTTSSQLAGVISDETGTGSLVFATTPTLTTPKINEDVALTATSTELNKLDGIGALTGVLRADSGTLSVDSDVTDIVAAASDSAAGKVELATIAEVDTSTDTGRAVTPDALAGSIYGKKTVYIQVSDPGGDAITTGDGKAYFTVPQELNGMNLVAAHASVTTVSSSGTPTIQIRNVTDSQDTLSTRITIDASENTSYTAATAPVINTSYDDVATGDILAVDIDVAGTGAKGLAAILTFQKP